MFGLQQKHAYRVNKDRCTLALVLRRTILNVLVPQMAFCVIVVAIHFSRAKSTMFMPMSAVGIQRNISVVLCGPIVHTQVFKCHFLTTTSSMCALYDRKFKLSPLEVCGVRPCILG